MLVDTARAAPPSPHIASSMDESRLKWESPHGIQPLVVQSRDLIRSRVETIPNAAIVLGTGLGELADKLEDAVCIDYRELPGFPEPTALAHRGRVVIGKLDGNAIVALQGRCHLYEGRSPLEVTFPLRVLAALGIQTLFLTNAAGGLHPRFAAGDVMAIEDHINLMFQTVPSAEPKKAEAPVAPLGRIYDPALLELANLVARKVGVPLQQGVYVGVTGPNYETRAEYRMMRRLGGDAVGMSTVLEALFACQLGLRVAAFSAITNIARPDAPDVVDAQEVVDVAEMIAPKIVAIFQEMLSRLPTR